MKPKTKLQRKIVRLSKKVDSITEEEKAWANEALFDNYFVECRNRYNCLECGHKWNPENAELSKHVLPTTCPSCEKRNLNHVNNWDTDKEVAEYWAIVDVIEGFQVVRMFMAYKYMKRKQPAQYHHAEVMQHWIREDGKMTSLTLRTNTMGTWQAYDSWSLGGDLEVRTKSRNHQLRCNLAPFKIRKGRKTLSIIRRNGYKGYFKGEAPHQFFSAILKYPKAETLLKADQIALFKRCVGYSDYGREKIDRYWKSICIAMRNDYIVEDTSDWFDYLGFLDKLDEDLHNPENVCPQDFEQEHNRLSEKIGKIREKEREEKRRKRMLKDQTDYVESKSPFFDLEFKAKGIKVVPLKSVREFIEEGDKLHHCINSSRYYGKEQSLILSARIDGEPVETVEVSLEKMKVIQARGLQNQPSEHHDTIINAVQKNMDKIAEINSQRKEAA